MTSDGIKAAMNKQGKLVVGIPLALIVVGLFWICRDGLSQYLIYRDTTKDMNYRLIAVEQSQSELKPAVESMKLSVREMNVKMNMLLEYMRVPGRESVIGDTTAENARR